MGFLDWLFPKEKDFYGMLARQSEVTLEGIGLFSDYICSENSVSMQQIIDIEHKGDYQRRLLIDDLNKTFITPIDREDLFGLSRMIDDIMDLSKSAVEEFTIYNLASNEHLKEMAIRIKSGVSYLNNAVTLLKDHPSISIEKCVACKDEVDEVEILYYKALTELAESADVKYMFKMREIYKHLLVISGRIADSANIILDIIVKTT